MYGEIMRNAWSDCLIVLFVSVSRYQPVSSIKYQYPEKKRKRKEGLCVCILYIIHTYIYYGIYMCACCGF